MNRRPKNCYACGGKPKMPYGGGPLTSAGAKEMLRDNSAHGHKLTPKQKRYFGYIAGGGKAKKQAGGTIEDYDSYVRWVADEAKKRGYTDQQLNSANIEDQMMKEYNTSYNKSINPDTIKAGQQWMQGQQAISRGLDARHGNPNSVALAGISPVDGRVGAQSVKYPPPVTMLSQYHNDKYLGTQNLGLTAIGPQQQSTVPKGVTPVTDGKTGQKFYQNASGDWVPILQGGGPYIDVNKFRRNTLIPGQDIPSGDPAMQYGNIQMSQHQDTFKPGVDIPYKDPAMEGYKPENRLQEAISKGIFQQPKDFNSPAAWYDFINTPADKAKPKKINPFALRVGYEGALTGLNAIAGGVERSRQNQYTQSQYASLGQEDAIPSSNYQPNPFSLYSRYGGRIRLQKGGKDPNSVVDFLSGTRLGNSFDQRASYFGDLVGGEHYTGSADQNIKLMSALKANPKYFGNESGIQMHPQVTSSRNIPAILGPQQSSGFSAAPSSTAQYLGLHPTKPNTASNTVTDSRSMSDLWRTGLTPNPVQTSTPVQSPTKGVVSPVAATNKLQSGIIQDKRKNVAYIIQDGKVTRKFPILTGKNPDLNSNTYSMDLLDANPNLRNTPVGTYMLNPEKDIYGHPGFAEDPIDAYGKPAPNATQMGFHYTYDEAVRGKLYGTPGSHISYACTNARGKDLEACLKAFPQGDTTRIIDTKMQEGKDVLSQYGIKRMGGALSKKKKYGSNSKYQTMKKDPVDADDELKSGGWIKSAAASIKRRGTEGKCTPITKPGCTGRAKALAKTFKKIARNRKHK